MVACMAGPTGVDDTDPWGRIEAQLGLDWTAGTNWRGRLHGLARAEDSDVPGPAVGLTEAWVGYQRAVGNQSELMARGGLMFYPSSQENIDRLLGLSLHPDLLGHQQLVRRGNSGLSVLIWSGDGSSNRARSGRLRRPFFCGQRHPSNPACLAWLGDA